MTDHGPRRVGFPGLGHWHLHPGHCRRPARNHPNAAHSPSSLRTHRDPRQLHHVHQQRHHALRPARSAGRSARHRVDRSRPHRDVLPKGLLVDLPPGQHPSARVPPRAARLGRRLASLHWGDRSSSWLQLSSQWSSNARRPRGIHGAFSTKYVRLRPTLPHRHQCSTIGAEGLSFRVRNGAGRFPFAMTAETLWRFQSLPTVPREPHSGRVASLCQVIGLLVPVSSMRYRTSTSGLSTQ